METARKRKRIEFDGSSQHQQPLTFVDADEDVVDADEDDDCELLSKEESKKKIYIHINSAKPFNSANPYKGSGSRWFIADPWLSTSLEEATVMMNSMPSILQNTEGYANALLKSKLYFLGGQIWDELKSKFVNLNTVFAFDLVTQTWDDPSEYPNLQFRRYFSRAEAVDDKIFVFGAHINHKLLKNGEYEHYYAEYLDLSISKEKRQWRYIFNTPKELWQKAYVQSIAVYNSNSNKASVGGDKHHFLFWSYPEGCLFILDYHSLKWQTVEQILGYLPKDPACTNQEEEPCTNEDIDIFLPPESYISKRVYPILAPCWSNTVVVQDDALFWHFGSRLYAIDFTNSNPEVGVIELCNFNYPPFLEYGDNNFGGSFFPATFLFSQGKGKLCLIWEGYDDTIRFYCQNFQFQRKNDGTLVACPGSLSNFDTHPDFSYVADLYLV